MCGGRGGGGRGGDLPARDVGGAGRRGQVAAAPTAAARLRYSWYDAEAAAAFLLNIPARFDFECAVLDHYLTIS